MNYVAIITLFHPEQPVVETNLSLLAKTGWSIIVTDNSPQSHQHWFDDTVRYLHFPDNAGIAAAQNHGLLLAKELGFKFAMLLDQDSKLSTAFLTAVMKRVPEAINVAPELAAYGPTIISEFSQQKVKAKVQRPKDLEDGFSISRQIIASGMVLPLSILDAVGLMEADLFIDGVDHEWCWRAQKSGFLIISDEQVSLLHRQGDARKRIAGVNFKIGSPVRLYYQYRNVLILVRRAYVPLYWKLRNLAALPIRWLVNGWLVDNGRQRRKYMTSGFKDGLKQTKGRYENDE